MHKKEHTCPNKIRRQGHRKKGDDPLLQLSYEYIRVGDNAIKVIQNPDPGRYRNESAMFVVFLVGLPVLPSKSRIGKATTKVFLSQAR